VVFVTVGNATQQFRRLLDVVNRVAEAGAFESEKVFIQAGHNPEFQSGCCEVQQFISMDEFERLMGSATLIICHGGCTQLNAVRLGKVPVVMPRREKYREHVNDHQLQLVRALAAEKKIVAAYEPEDLMPAIAEARRLNEHPVAIPSSPMISLVEQAIEEIRNAKCEMRNAK
jgi:UDP-N-acetylglucosamine transferase subunit ALG13